MCVYRTAINVSILKIYKWTKLVVYIYHAFKVQIEVTYIIAT